MDLMTIITQTLADCFLIYSLIGIIIVIKSVWLNLHVETDEGDEFKKLIAKAPIVITIILMLAVFAWPWVLKKSFL